MNDYDDSVNDVGDDDNDDEDRCGLQYWSGVRGKSTPAMLKLMLGRLSEGCDHKHCVFIVFTLGVQYYNCRLTQVVGFPHQET